MGTDKVNVTVAGVPMVGHVAAALEAAGLEVVTMGGPDRVPGYTNIPDPPGMHGPLAGLAGALDHAGGGPVIVVAVDQPLVRPATIEHLAAIQRNDAIIPLHNGYPQVTCALYRATCLPAIRRIASVNPAASIRDLIEFINVRYLEPEEWAEWGEDGRSWLSIDTPEDLAAIEADLENS